MFDMDFFFHSNFFYSFIFSGEKEIVTSQFYCNKSNFFFRLFSVQAHPFFFVFFSFSRHSLPKQKKMGSLEKNKAVWGSVFLSLAALLAYLVQPLDIPLGRIAGAVFFPILFMGYGLKRKSIDLSGALVGWVVASSQYLTHISLFCSLGAFFMTSSILTKFKSRAKAKIEDDFKEGGQRNWVQVLCNGGPNTLYAFLYLFYQYPFDASINTNDQFGGFLLLASMCGFACCNGDTWASEVGSVLASSNPRLITTWKEVPKGTNGGVSLVGTLASAAGGGVVGLAYYLSGLAVEEGGCLSCLGGVELVGLGVVSGFVGSMIDSLFGATVQYSGYDKEKKRVVAMEGKNVTHICGADLLDNHLVNLLASLVTGVLVAGVVVYLL